MLKGQQMNNTVNAKNLEDFLGKEVGLTDWIEIDQDRINKFAEATGDFQYIHVDKDRAAKTPFGTTIAHGFLTLSLLSKLSSMNGGIKLEKRSEKTCEPCGKCNSCLAVREDNKIGRAHV